MRMSGFIQPKNYPMKRKDPSDLQIKYPTRRAKPGQKAAARANAYAAGVKTFQWHCPTHGMALFSTAGSGSCRQCLAAARRKVKQRHSGAAHALTE